jgi:two-component system, NarL family, response regulator DevR
MTKTRIMIVDDHEVVRMGMRAAFETEPDLTVVGEASNGAEALAKMPVLAPQLILMDVRMEKMNGIEACREIKSRYPDVHILMITSYSDDDAVISSILAGASGYLLKNTPRVELLQAVEQVHAGGAPMTMQIARKVMDHFRKIQQPAAEVEKLTPREQEVLALLAKGYLYKQIGDELGISINTLRNRLRAIYEKLHVHSRTEATVKFLGRD